MSNTQASENGRSAKRQKVAAESMSATRIDNVEIEMALQNNLFEDDKDFDDDRAWLKHRFGKKYPISVRFGADPTTYVFAEDTLVMNFEYFRAALTSNSGGAVSMEGQTRTAHLKGVASRAFARLYRFILKPETRAIHPYCPIVDKIDHLFHFLIAADYLGMKCFDDFEKNIAEHLVLNLLNDRRNLTSRHIWLVTKHHAFRSKLIWKILVASGVRPFLQEHLTATDYDEPFGSGHHDPKVWYAGITHCSELRESHELWTFDITKQVIETLKEGSIRFQQCGQKGALLFTEPLVSFLSANLKNTCRSQFII